MDKIDSFVFSLILSGVIGICGWIFKNLTEKKPKLEYYFTPVQSFILRIVDQGVSVEMGVLEIQNTGKVPLHNVKVEEHGLTIQHFIFPPTRSINRVENEGMSIINFDVLAPGEYCRVIYMGVGGINTSINYKKIAVRCDDCLASCVNVRVVKNPPLFAIVTVCMLQAFGLGSIVFIISYLLFRILLK